MSKLSYNTPARRALLGFLRENRDRQFSSRELADRLAAAGASGRSTVYRQLSLLCEEGIVRRYTDGRTPLYQYFSEGGCGGHFHMKCSSCGRLFHLECDEMTSLSDHIRHEHDFSLDRAGTVLLGLCGRCSHGGRK